MIRMSFITPRTMTLSAESKLKRNILWFLLAALAIAPLLPLSNYVGLPHWDLIRWIPFQDFSLSRNKLTDVLGNVLWFTTFGYLLRYQLNERFGPLRAIATIIVIASGISLSVEFFQVFCHNRIPSMTDVICNVFGAGIGGYVAEKQRATAATRLAHYALVKNNDSQSLP